MVAFGVAHWCWSVPLLVPAPSPSSRALVSCPTPTFFLLTRSAGTADPVFVNGTGSPAFLNGTNLQFDVNAYPFSFDASPSDTNYARWENVGIVAGFGSGPWVNDGSSGLRVDSEESGKLSFPLFSLLLAS